MKNKKNVYAILVAYNPDSSELQLAVDNLLSQTDFVVVCNNSDYDVTLHSADRIRVFNFRENLGIAEAQSIGMKWAFENGADFILQMDQDSLLQEHTVTKLMDRYFELTKVGYTIGVIGPRHYDKITKEVDEGRLIKGNNIPGHNCHIIHATISSASLIPLSAYEAAGSMDDGLFIDSVDWEYCWRLKKLGFITVRDNDVLLGHRVGEGKQKLIGSIDARIPSPIRHYYHTRNLFLLFPRAYVPIYWKLSNLFKLFIKLFVYPFAFKDGKVRFKYIVCGIKDGLLGRYGRIDNATRKNNG